MKYIRTKDERIIETKGWYWCDDVFGNKAIHQVNSPFEDIEEENIIAQADTIEELCDAFIVKYKKIYRTEHNIVKRYERLYVDDWHKKNIKDGRCSIYGMVWVTLSNDAPRLEPVAKMNEKGGWELL